MGPGGKKMNFQLFCLKVDLTNQRSVNRPRTSFILVPDYVDVEVNTHKLKIQEWGPCHFFQNSR